MTHKKAVDYFTKATKNKSDEPAMIGCNALIEEFKKNTPIGALIRLKSGRSGILTGGPKSGYEFGLPRNYILLEKRNDFAICGLKLPGGEMIRECFLYHEILLQHGQVRK